MMSELDIRDMQIDDSVCDRAHGFGTSTVPLCDDCTVWIANRDDSGASPEWIERVDEIIGDPPFDTFRVALGIPGRFVTVLDPWGDPHQHDFDTDECYGCETRLAGRRTYHDLDGTKTI